MSLKNIFRNIACLCIVAVALLLSGCPSEDSMSTVNSNQLATSDIGFNISLSQHEREDEIRIEIDAHSTTDGFDRSARVQFSTQDVLSVSVQGQELALLPTPARLGRTFVATQSSLSLPATFLVKFSREGGRENALNTSVTLNAVFETISPMDAASVSRDDEVEFKWALRDGDGNTIAGTNAISAVTVHTKGGDFDGPSTVVVFDSINVAQDGASRFGRIPALKLVPTELVNRDDGPWDILAQVTTTEDQLTLPVTVEFDPALANNRSMKGVFTTTNRVFRKHIDITVR